MPKILHITNAYPTKRYPIYGIFIKEQIDSLGSPDLKHVWFINGREKGKWAYLWALLTFPFKIKQYDMIHCHHIYIAMIAVFMAPFKPKIVSFLSDEHNLYNKGLKKWIYDRIVRKFNGIIFKKEIPAPLLHSDKVLYLPNGVNMDFFNSMPKDVACDYLNLDKTKRYIVFVSGYDLYRPEKQFIVLKKAYDILVREPEFKDLEILTVVSRPRHEIPYCFNASEVHVLISLYEGSPNSVKEAMACNIPVIATPAGNIPFMLADAEGGYIIHHLTVDNLVNTLKTVLNQTHKPDLRRVLCEKGLDMQSVARKLESYYDKILLTTI